jgi:1-acyl-sn-glycerol-3-phosphate acyltransferase
MKHQKKHIKFRHGFFLVIFKVVFGPFLKFYYRFSAKKISVKKGGPYLILSNHTSEFDTIFMGLSFDRPLYFVASDQLLNSGFGSWFLKFFFNPIPKSKSMSDMTLVKRMVKVISEKGNIVLYPEGNSSMNGGPVFISETIGKLIKFLQVPVILVNAYGLYLSSPRWSYHRKFGRSTIEKKAELSKAMIEMMSAEELSEYVKQHLDVHLYKTEQTRPFIGKNKAEGLHKLIFTCPSCHGLFTTYSKGDHLLCHQCQLKATYDNFGYLHINNRRLDLVTADENNKQVYEKKLKDLGNDYVLSSKCEVSFWRIEQRRRTLFQAFEMELNKDDIILKHDEQISNYPLINVVSAAIQVRTKLLIYFKDGTILLIRFPVHISPYAYLITLQIYTKMFTLGGNPIGQYTTPTLGI